MKKTLFFTVILAVLAFGALSAQYQQIYSQPYPGYSGGVPTTDQAYTSTLTTAQNVDYRYADNFSGLTDPITKITVYGVTSMWNGYWVAADPAATEPFHVRFYNYTGSWTQPPQPLTAEITGTYTVNLYDSYGDGWNGGSLDVLVNGVVVLDDITLAAGAGPEAYTFTANAGDEITTTFTTGNWAHENWYEILDPNNVVIATDGENQTIPTGIFVNVTQPLIAPETGTYTVNLYDDEGDGWDTSKLNVYVNGNVVLENITLASGAGPEAYTFTANVGDEITTLFMSGAWPDENWYEILDPNDVVIATDGPNPQGIGFVSTYEIDEPDWNNPAHEYLALDVTTTYIGPTGLAGDSGFYQFDIILPEPVNMAEGWFSAQISIDDGATVWFLWSVCDGAYGDGSSWQYVAAKSRDTFNAAYVANGNVRDHKTRDVAFTLYTGEEITNDITVPGPESTLGGTLPAELQGTDAIIYTVESTGIRNVTVLKPAEITGDWYCWLQDAAGLHSANNPIPADTESWTFYEVVFDAKVPVTVVISGRDLNTVPVELSSFNAVLTAQNFVKLTWISQTETGMWGYRVYRGESDNQAASLLLTPVLIPATNTSSTQVYELEDKEVEIGNTYWYWLEAVEIDGTVQFYGQPASVTVTGEVPPVLPTATTLGNAYPNPFKQANSTTIDVSIKQGENGTVTIYNILGQVVKTFSVNEGEHQLNWNGKDARGNNCGSGIYFYKLSTPSTNMTKKMVIVK